MYNDGLVHILLCTATPVSIVLLLSLFFLLCHKMYQALSLVPRLTPVRFHESRHRAWYLKSRAQGPG